MNTHFTYFFILAASLAGPLALSFDKKVRFYKKWKYVFPAMLLPALFYIIWDYWFTSIHIWNFAEAYTLGIKLFNLPVEEVAFFFVIPYCCVFIYECICWYFPKIWEGRSADNILKLMAIALLLMGLLHFKKAYTASTFIFTAIFIIILTFFKNYFLNFKTSAFLISFAIILIPFLIVNGILTSIPVVVYNNNENMGIRIFTIPFEDVFYGMLLLLMNVAGYEWLQRNYKPNSQT